MSVNRLTNKRLNISTIDLKPSSKFKLKLPKKDKLKKFNNISSYTSLKTKNEKKINKYLSSFLFQNNDVDMVRSLNPDSDNNLCDNLLFKENLINNMGSDDNFDMPEQLMGQKISLPKIKRLTVNGILETQKKLNRNKQESLRNIANNQLEKELYQELKEIREKYKEIKNKKNGLYENYNCIMNKINDINLDLKLFELRQKDNFLSKILENNTKELENQKIQREKRENENKFNQKIINTLNEKIPNLVEGLNMEKINEKMNLNNNNTNESNNSNKNESHLNSKSKNQIEEKMLKFKSLYLAKKEQEQIKFEKIQKIKQLRDDLNELEAEINSLNKELISLREKDDIIVQKLMKHFQALLFKGRDTRNEGLIWIIKAMWNLGKNVPMQFIPTFLDFKSIEFLFKLANRSIELESKKKLLNEKKKNVKIKLHKIYFFNTNEKNSHDSEGKQILPYKAKNSSYNNYRKHRSSIIFKTNLIRNNSVLRDSVRESNFIKSYIHSSVDEEEEENKKEPNTFKEISMIIERNKKNYEIKKISDINDIDKLQLKIKEIEIEIENLKSNEIKRIFREFIVNDYQNKYHVSVDVVLAALLGEHTKNIEVHKFSKFKREYFEAIKNLRFYEYAKHKDSN